MEIALIEPFFSGSHELWARSLKKYSKHKIHLITMPGRHWKWRMHGGAITAARLYSEQFGQQRNVMSADLSADNTDFYPDLILATDMLDLTTFLALNRRQVARIPVALYFHENQFSYPDRDHKNVRAGNAGNDVHYPFINYVSALAADRLYFNSQFHLNDFLTEIGSYPSRFPDFREPDAAQSLTPKSFVLPLGLDLQGMDADLSRTDSSSSPDDASIAQLRAGPPVILWNHRREHDKNPEEFFTALIALKKRGCDFRLVVLGQSFSEVPEIFTVARERLHENIVRFEPAANRLEYFRWLKSCDICPVTSYHDYFGAAVVEAMFAGCYPLLPARLAYPEHVGEESEYLYADNADLLARLEHMLRFPETWRNPKKREEISQKVARYDWSRMIEIYDREFEQLIQSTAAAGASEPGVESSDPVDSSGT